MYIKIIKKKLIAKQLKILFEVIAFNYKIVLFITIIVAINIVDNSAMQELFNKNKEQCKNMQLINNKEF